MEDSILVTPENGKNKKRDSCYEIYEGKLIEIISSRLIKIS